MNKMSLIYSSSSLTHNINDCHCDFDALGITDLMKRLSQYIPGRLVVLNVEVALLYAAPLVWQKKILDLRPL